MIQDIQGGIIQKLSWFLITRLNIELGLKVFTLDKEYFRSQIKIILMINRLAWCNKSHKNLLNDKKKKAKLLKILKLEFFV